MKREYIFGIVGLLAVIALPVGAYQFYLKERMVEYQQNDERLAQLRELERSLSSQFGGYRPEYVVAAFEGMVKPWQEAVLERAERFDLGTLDPDVEVPADQGAKFWYEQEFQKRYFELQNFAYSQGVMIPNTTFGAITPQELAGRDMGPQLAAQSMEAFERGAGLIRELVDAGARQISNVSFLPPVDDPPLQVQPIALEFWMTMDQLVGFLEEQGGEGNGEEEYADVPLLRVTNNTLRYPQPLLHVEMVLCRASYKATPVTRTGSVSSRMDSLRTGGGGFTFSTADRPARKPPTWWEKFRKNWLPF